MCDACRHMAAVPCCTAAAPMAQALTDSVAAVQEVKRQTDPDLLVLETDNVLFKDDGFRCPSVLDAITVPSCCVMSWAVQPLTAADTAG